ncbi:MarR family winged helix-turn-helix transcriptional regulator [Streptomyces noursei]|uniref:MarR family transcriptional regulator n=1 Tax=Streptomyces noursei TaxID=1971 RepID=A0A401R9R5_STRNR|nr:MarR family transcriptional regulator [Streptomyces noursei]AKA06613.1 MarR family transcriptional regulator [Streptomyces noursei ZPM]EOT05585.1 MarR family transcriptional regulator [Streptomyces noursei CCRC 11814]EXU87726.1 MarR family transcriptional regulator [Streptomyces noursei PD-1]MCZ0970664.1 MarR family transcriptional regulator [Streptomyces noursei]UWS75124.1 MarR family transcriptional regulator [Streptomyces noursei]
MTENPGPHETAATAQRLNDAIKRLRARLRTESGQHATGLSATQLGVLANVVREGPVTAARLAAAEHVSAQAIAQSLAVLKAAGLVHSRPDPNDGRKKLMSADPSATELIDKLLAGRAAFLARAIDRVVAADERPDMDRAIDLLQRLADADVNEGPL